MDASARNRNSGAELASVPPMNVEVLSRLSGRSVDALREMASSTEERQALIEQLMQNPTIRQRYGQDVDRLEQEVGTILETLESKGSCPLPAPDDRRPDRSAGESSGSA
jgi:hypothetical protein